LKHILVTGASGFIGRALVLYLAERGFAVRAASRRPSPVGEGIEAVPSPDLAGSPDWAPLLEGIDVIVHTAAIAHTRGIDAAMQDAVNHRAVAALAGPRWGRWKQIRKVCGFRPAPDQRSSCVRSRGRRQFEKFSNLDVPISALYAATPSSRGRAQHHETPRYAAPGEASRPVFTLL
jgi:NAD(P)-dependent dehydrogenase (short-subunit alcohol dehydrogenase family)